MRVLFCLTLIFISVLFDIGYILKRKNAGYSLARLKRAGTTPYLSRHGYPSGFV